MWKGKSVGLSTLMIPPNFRVREGNGSQRLDHNPKYQIILKLKPSFCGDDESVYKHGWGEVIINIQMEMQKTGFTLIYFLFRHNFLPLTKCSGSLLNEDAN